MCRFSVGGPSTTENEPRPMKCARPSGSLASGAPVWGAIVA